MLELHSAHSSKGWDGGVQNCLYKMHNNYQKKTRKCKRNPKKMPMC